MAIKLIILLAVFGIAACAAVLAWRRRQHRRLLNGRETAHLLRQARYLQQLAQTTLYCKIDSAIALVLLQLAEETLADVAAAGQPDACGAIDEIRSLGQTLEQNARKPGRMDRQSEVRDNEDADGADIHDIDMHDIKPVTREPVVAPSEAAMGEPDYARIRLHLTDAARLLHQAFRKGYIDRGQHEQMTGRIQKARLQADIKQMLLRETEARTSGDLARARACLSQARTRLVDQDATLDMRKLLADIDHRLAELDQIVTEPGRCVTLKNGAKAGGEIRR